MCMGGAGYNRQCAAVKSTCGIKMQLYKKHLNLNAIQNFPNTCSLHSGLVESLHSRPTRRARLSVLFSELLQAAECAISLAAARRIHVYLATRGC